jgi:tRNA(Ile)-lysidine synthetase-like protein
MNYQLLKIKKDIKLVDLIDFWFNNPKVWFNCTKEDDEFIKDIFSYLLWNEQFYHHEFCDKYTFLGKIILYDQISRHIYRDHKSELKKYDKIAYRCSLILLPVIETFKPEERCFILMPFRHSRLDQFNLELCLDYINKWLNEDNTINIYKRFYQATVTALSNLKNKNNTLYIGDIHFIPEHIYDADSCKIDYNYAVNINKIIDHKLYHEFCKYINKKNGNIIISLSGGVDSMVCSLLLYIYSIQNKDIKLIAVCINYTNRSDQYFEVEMVYKWTKILGIEFHVREISEIKRETCTEINRRDFYEKITKNIRFETYKKFNAPVILGHNKDDCIENIFANIVKKKNYNNLLGMSYRITENSVEILRPLLNISKAEIFDFAKEFSVPYTYDSTPKWADRAKMRDVLIPQIKEFNPLILDGLIELSNNFKEIYSVYNKCIPNIIYEENHCIVENKDIFFLDYWKNIFTKISLHYKLPFIKNKSVEYFIDNIKSGNRITLNIHFVACLKKNDIFVYVR